MRNEITFFCGAALFVAGIAVVYWPAALIVAGLSLMALAIRLEQTAATPGSTASEETKQYNGIS